MLIVAPTEGYDSLVSLADADAYWQRMGGAEWAALDDPSREAALRRGTQFILARSVKEQYLDPVHTRVAAAACEAAMLHVSGELYGVIDAKPVLREQVGEVAISYGQPTNGGRARFPIIDDLLRGLAAGTGMVAITRA